MLLSGNYLTENLTNRTRYLLPPLTFLGTGADAWWRVDADDNQGALNGHVNFTLNETSGAIGLFSGGGVQLEAVSFGSQAFNVSSGRYPDGSATIRTFPETPTPGAMNVVLADTDNDGLADVWEMAHFGNLAQIASGDADGDGDSNLDEYRAGTDPRNPADVLRCDVVEVAGAIVVRFAAAPNKSYTVQFKNALSDPSWQKLADIPPDLAPRNIEVSDPFGASQSTRFYRAVTPVQP